MVTRFVLGAIVIGLTVTLTAAAVEWKTVEVKKYGYTLKIPKEFEIVGDEPDKGTSWIYQPGSSATSTAKKKTKKFGVGGVKIGGLRVGGSQSVEDSVSSGGSSGGLESALTVYVNWTWMPDVSSQTMFDANYKSDKENAESPDPDYTDLVVLNKENGYPNFEGGIAYRYKEVDKKKGDEIHRWHIKAFGNKSSYTIGLTGTYEQFEEWGPVFEEVMKSFKLIPLESDS